MKKLALVLTLALVLAFAAPVFANPFSDVPADHWAYDAISKLYADGVITGNPDGTFTGKRNMTRYELATIIAKAMATTEANAEKVSTDNQALINKLAAEFGTELDALGVRVANLEKKVGNVKFSGDARVRYRDQETKLGGQLVDNVFGHELTYGKADMRIRLTADAAVNDKVSVVARFTTDDYQLNQSDTGNADSKVDNFYVKYADKAVTATVGRQDLVLGKGTIFDDTIKGAVVSAPVGSYTATIAHGYLDDAALLDDLDYGYLGGRAEKTTLTAIQFDGIKLGEKVTLGLDYGIVKIKEPIMDRDDVKLWGVNFDYALNDKVILFGEYTKSDFKFDGVEGLKKDATTIGVNVKDLVKDTNLKVSYAKLGNASVMPGLYTFDTPYTIAWAGGMLAKLYGEDFEYTKLWNIRLDRPVMKNTNLYVEYTNAKTDSDTETKFTRLDTGLEFKF